jgi:hypothetical protein
VARTLLQRAGADSDNIKKARFDFAQLLHDGSFGI